MNFFLGAVPLLFLLLCSSCAAEPFVMEEMIDRKISGLTIGAPKEDILPKFGQPQFVTTIPRGPDSVEIWQYGLGNYTHYEERTLVFMNGHLMATPRDSFALLKLLKALHILNDADFWVPKQTFSDGEAAS